MNIESWVSNAKNFQSLFFRELGEEAVSKAKIIYDKFTKGREIRSNYIKLGKEKKEEYGVNYLSSFFSFNLERNVGNSVENKTRLD